MKPARAAARAALALAAYVAIAAIYTHPLLVQARDRIASDRYDPVLNASILWWNATTLPFSDEWWTPPHYYPVERAATFTENLVGLWPIASPVYYVTHDPLLTYNLTLFLTWPLSALAVFLLATALGARWGPAFIGGLAFGFAPYRITQLSHLQVLAPFWLPLALAALHLYLRDRRKSWLVAFGIAWLLQALTNGYFMLFGGVLIGLWLLYFCSTRATIRLLPMILGTWTLASLPLLPVLLEYKRVHEHFGFERPLGAVQAYSAQASAWLQTTDRLALWGGVLPDGGEEANLFPGVTVLLVLVVSAGMLMTSRNWRASVATPHSRARVAVAAVGMLAAAVVLYTVAVGPWRVEVAGVVFRVGSIDRALVVAFGCGGWLAFARRTGPDATRSPAVFYALATLAIVMLCLGPQIRSGTRVVMESAPYGWLMALPGFDGLRVPTRFWMLGTLCLAMAAALTFERVAPRSARRRAAWTLILSLGVLADGWIGTMSMAPPPGSWVEVEPTGRDAPLIELPLGPEFDAAATYRAVGHRRRVVNGVSGYDPPHYAPLQRGLAARNPDALLAFTHVGPLDIVVDASTGEGQALLPYVESLAGALAAGADGVRRLYHLPARPTPPVARGGRLAVQSVRAARGVVDLQAALDGDLRTASILPAPQHAGEWIELDLGSRLEVSGFEYGFGDDVSGAPGHLVIEVSGDGVEWESVWQGRGFQHALAALMRNPRGSRISLGFEPRPVRYLRLRLLADADAPWRIADVVVTGTQ